MIFITARFPVKPEHADDWASITRDFTDATQAEPGCLWFQWSRSLTDRCEYVLVEAFSDDEAGAAHVGSAHFNQATRTLPGYLTATPKIINAQVDGADWTELGEMAVS